ncbi:MAG TPA: hypothetical protein VGE11_23665 [Pseudonocardia sp.]
MPATRAARDATGRVGPARFAATKVPQITLLFWVAKLLTTGMGETTWDWFNVAMGQTTALTVTGLALVAALVAQLAMRRYNPWVYWAAVVMVSVFGTAVADTAHNDFGVPYTMSTLVLLIVVGAVFALWYLVEGTLSIHSIYTRRREAFYWAAVLLTFALGTAAGDWTATSLHLGYFPSGIVFLVVFLLPAVAHRWLGLAAVPAFWLSYIVTRPLGASFADFMAGPPSRGGLALGMPPISIVLTVLIVAVVAYFAKTRIDVPRADQSPETIATS